MVSRTRSQSKQSYEESYFDMCKTHDRSPHDFALGELCGVLSATNRVQDM